MHSKAQKLAASAISVAIALSGCATASKDVTTQYVSPLQYQQHDCDQLSGEVTRVHNRLTQVGGRLDEAASNDQGIMATGLILFWPALFFLGGTKQQEAEYGRLKGEYEAIQQAAVLKKCTLVLPKPEPKPVEAQQAVQPVTMDTPQ